MKRKRNKREIEVMTGEETIKREREGKQRWRERAGCLSFCSLSVQTSQSLWCTHWLFVCLRMGQPTPVLQKRSTDYSKVHLHVK